MLTLSAEIERLFATISPALIIARVSEIPRPTGSRSGRRRDRLDPTATDHVSSALTRAADSHGEGRHDYRYMIGSVQNWLQEQVLGYRYALHAESLKALNFLLPGTSSVWW